MFSGGGLRRILWLVPVVGVVCVLLLASGVVRWQPLVGGLVSEPHEREAARAMPHGAAPSATSPAARAPQPQTPAVAPDPALAVPAWTDSETSAVAPGSFEAMDCIIEPWELVDVGSPIAGTIEKILVERGEFVEKGQVIVLLASRVEQAAVELARARAEMKSQVKAREAELDLRESRRERGDKLFTSQAMSLDVRQELETEAQIARLEYSEALENQRLAKLELERAKAALERRKIRSPVAGFVVSRAMSPGEVPYEDTILTIAQVNPLRVDVVLPAAMFGTVKKGMRAAIMPELPDADVRVASIGIVDPVLDAASGTFGVQLELPNADFSTPGGLHCRVRFEPD